MSNETQPTDTSKMDPLTKKAFELAIKFHEADKDLTRNERDILAKTYSKILYTTLGVGWTTFFSVAAIPFYRQKLKTGSTKGANVSLAIIAGLFSMMLTSPYGTKHAYNSQLGTLQEKAPNCFKVAKILKPSESTKWMMYYKLTTDHPEHIMKDPRSLAAAQQRQKTIYSGKDPMGLYSGPRTEILKGTSNYPYSGEESKQPHAQTNDQSSTDQLINNNNSNNNNDDDDPFNDVEKQKNTYASAWQKVRSENGIKSDDSSWDKVRTGGYGNPFSTNVYASKKEPEAYKKDDLQNDFDMLLEQERNVKEEEENKRW